MSTYTNKEIVCSCGTMFVWTKGEQKFMQTLLTNGVIQVLEEPKRCRECKEIKKIRNKK